MKAKTLTAEQDEKFHHLRVATELALDGLNISSDERDRYSVLREGTKLILNSASGAADANFESNIRSTVFLSWVALANLSPDKRGLTQYGQSYHLKKRGSQTCALRCTDGVLTMPDCVLIFEEAGHV